MNTADFNLQMYEKTLKYLKYDVKEQEKVTCVFFPPECECVVDIDSRPGVRSVSAGIRKLY